MREVIGETPIAQALAEGRGKIETDTHSLLQGILDAYGAGVVVTQLQLLKVDPPGPVILDAHTEAADGTPDPDPAHACKWSLGQAGQFPIAIFVTNK